MANIIRAILIFLTSANISFSANIIVNPGFETGRSSSWILDGADQFPDAWKITTTNVHSGQFALMADNWPKRATQTFAPISGQDIIQVSFWAQQTNPYRIEGTLRYSDGTSTFHLFPVSETTFEFYDLTPYLNRSKQLSGISLEGFASGNAYNTDNFFDDVTVNVVPEPSIGVFFLAGTALAFRRRGLIVTVACRELGNPC
jgi:hypothetical protein